ncbi:helix-turn-helix domain-containing protein [Bacillus sp. SA1-12]|uniref:helix-turn-helix domain-containing protein n=1 Tax=Bacillus sp. SA1-12 TaxID=1455638 RepID=UPI000626F5DF|nr:helix-turn-helix transcriptional regulator [Bacillus sp. SA1-12]KKI88641.1 helix-turn-helix domain-containing protein [Bacillus sp. SA1-12]
MKIGRAAKAVKEARCAVNLTQQQLSFEIFESREAISQQENGRYRVQPNIATYFANEHNDPFPAIEAAHEYTKWGIAKLDGEAADLHRSSISIKTKEELMEALEAVSEANKKLTVNPKSIEQIDIKVIEKSIQESIDAITALTHYVAILCKEYRISWVKMWAQHKMKLISRRFLKNG